MLIVCIQTLNCRRCHNCTNAQTSYSLLTYLAIDISFLQAIINWRYLLSYNALSTTHMFIYTCGQPEIPQVGNNSKFTVYEPV